MAMDELLAYLILCLSLKCRLPGVNTIPDQISRNKKPYYKALESADEAFAEDRLDLTELEKYVAALLAGQLVSVHKEAVAQPKVLDP